ncbi:VIT1/CCC1 transporter family protein [Chitinolyticbacter albus]|uniref:VIT1/CCC1 transporter family protein n=1 Tax=Chitinolyticbacter albus TaxID=2961951 RepID=UPI00210A54B6|nr:VIT1/CCC1 transporter family protein [Chitinolyticbacter albus]
MTTTLDPQVAETRPRLLDTVDRVCEMCFGLFMALTFVGAVSAVAGPDEDPGRTMFATALGCNLAWGLADAVMYLIRTLTERGRKLSLVRAVHGASDPAGAVARLRDALSPALQTLVDDAELEAIRSRLAKSTDLPVKPGLGRQDYLAATGIFLLVVLATFPVALPFIIFSDVSTALVVSRVLTIVMLFGAGLALGRHAGFGGWMAGLAMTLLGIALTAAIIMLGG